MQTFEIIGKSTCVQKIRERVAELGSSRLDVLITGPEGSGKGLVAKCIHQPSIRTQPLYELQCSVLDKEEVGRHFIEMVEYKSVILHQAESLSTVHQEQLALFATRKDRQTRLFVTMNKSAESLHAERRLHPEFNRVLQSLERIVILPLTERREDIPPLVRHFIREEARNLGFGEIALDINTLDLMVRRPWKGNVKELKSTIERCLVFSDGKYFALPEEMAHEAHAFTAFVRKLEAKGVTTIDDGLEMLERQILRRVLSRFGYDEQRAAAFLEMPAELLHEKTSRLGIIPTAENARS